MNQNNLKYIIYCRKSSESEDKQVQSLEDQMERLKELAKNLNLNVVDTLSESKSAKRPDNRPKFTELLKRIESGEAEAILCWQLNRLSRNPPDSGRLQWMLQEGTIKEIRTYDRVYSPQDNQLLFAVESGMANQFILDLRKNTNRGLAKKIRDGWYPSQAPIGYLNEVISKTITPDPERWEIVRKCWDYLLAEKYNVAQLHEIAINEWNLTTLQKKRTGGRPVSLTAFYEMFANPFYTGMFKYRGKIHEGKHQPMVTAEEFDRAQYLIGRKTKAAPQKHSFSYTGIITCGFCEGQITAEKIKKKLATGEIKHYVYYRCTHHKKDIICKQPSIKKQDLEGQIDELLKQITIPEVFRNWALNVIKTDNAREVEARQKIYESNEKAYRSLIKQRDTLTDLRLKELISDAEFTEKREEIDKRLNTTKEKLDQTHIRAQDWYKTIETAFNFAADARERFTTTDDIQIKRTIFQTLGNKFILQDKILSVEFVEWLKPISNEQEKLQESAITFELAKNYSTKRKNKALDLVFSAWGDRAELNRR